MKNLFFTTVIIFFNGSIYAQQLVNSVGNVTYVGNVAKPVRNNTASIAQLFDNGYQGVKGNPFYPENWTQGKIKFSNGVSANYKRLKYDVVKNRLWQLDNRKQLKTFDPKLVDEFSLLDSGQNKFIRFKHLKRDIKVQNGDDLESGYYIFLHEEKTALIKHRTHVIFEADHYMPYGTGRSYDKLKQVERYYIRDLSGGYFPFSKNKRSILSFMKKHKAKVKSFIKKNDISLKNEDDLVRVFAYFDSLIEIE